MDNRSNAVAAAGGAVGADPAEQRSSEDWRLAREAHKELQMVGMPRTNVLLVATADVTRIVLEMLWLELREPILTWRPGQRLELPSLGRAATLVLRDITELTHEDQLRVLEWLDATDGRIPVVSTTAVPLWPRVKAGFFSDVLYYRLNTVYVSMAA